MATAKTGSWQHRQPARWKRNAALLVLLAIIIGAGVFWSRLRQDALASTAYAAQAGCLCRFAAGRSLQACAADPAVARDWVRLSDDEAERSVTASVPALAAQTSRWSAQSGCMLDPWPR